MFHFQNGNSPKAKRLKIAYNDISRSKQIHWLSDNIFVSLTTDSDIQVS